MVRRQATLLALVLSRRSRCRSSSTGTDDTFIFLRYAEKPGARAGLAFNPGEPVYGFTSHSLVLVLAVPAALGIPGALRCQGDRIRRRMRAVIAFAVLARRRLGLVLAGPAALAFAANAWLVRWSAAAMESALAVALLVAGLARHAAEVETTGSAARRGAPRARGPCPAGVGLLLAFVLGLRAPGRRRPRAPARGGRWRPLRARPRSVVRLCAPHLRDDSSRDREAKGRLALAGLDLDPLRDVARAVATTSGLEALLAVAGLVALATQGPWRRDRMALRRPRAGVLWLACLPLLYLATGFDVLSRYALPLIPVVVLYGFLGSAC